MAILKILHYPDERLRLPAEPVLAFDKELRQFIDDMFETMYAAPGIGLAANQVNVQKRLIVMDISEDNSQPLCLINPEIVEHDGSVTMEEGCLSVPSVYDNVKRYQRIVIKALDRNGKPFSLEADELLSVCIQHEMDHLDGKLFVDYLSEVKRTRIKKKLAKLRRETL